MGRKATKLAGWMARWGFATLVTVGFIAAACAASTVQPLAEVPSFALQAAPVYRLEVGAAVFVGIYLASMALVLALNNRAFSEVGMSGFKAQDIGRATQAQTIRVQQRELADLAQIVARLQEKIERDAKGGSTVQADDN